MSPRDIHIQKWRLKMNVIGAGLPRTATLTQKVSLEMLGLGPCYHMVNVLSDLSLAPQWAAAFDGSADWDAIFEGHQSSVDWPGSFHWRELMDVYPGWHDYIELMKAMWRKSGLIGEMTAAFDPNVLASAMERYNQEVRDTVPASRLLEWKPSDGWEPLCQFLDVPVPPAPL